MPVILACALLAAIVVVIILLAKPGKAPQNGQPTNPPVGTDSPASIDQPYPHAQSNLSAYANTFLPNIYVDGIHIGGMTFDEALSAVNQASNNRQNWSLSLNYQGHCFITLNASHFNVYSNNEYVYNLLVHAYEFGHHADQQQNKIEFDYFVNNRYDLYTGYTNADAMQQMNTTQLDQYLAQIGDYFNREPSDAKLVYFRPDYWDEPFGIQPDAPGYALNVNELRQQIIARFSNGESGAIELQPTIIPAKVTEQDIRNTVTLRGESITPVDSSSTTARTDNIRVALSRYHGLKVKSGDTVSFNRVVGARSMENGFQMAIEYVNGLNEYGWGGGVCQASTTVYKAALDANLAIVNRTSHSDQVSYTEFGQDATVYYSSGRKIDFSFKNNTNNTLYIMARVEEKSRNKYQCVVRIYGPSLGEGVDYKLRTETVETILAPLSPEYQEDTNHTHVTYVDEEPYLLRKARDGFVNKTYLQRWENGVLVSEQLISEDTCKARSALYLVGTKKR